MSFDHRVSLSFWVYGISGYLVLGIWYFNAKNRVLRITLFLNFGYKVYHVFSNFGILHEF